MFKLGVCLEQPKNMIDLQLLKWHKHCISGYDDHSAHLFWYSVSQLCSLEVHRQIKKEKYFLKWIFPSSWN